MSMKTLLRHTRTGLYFQGPDHWTKYPEEGLDFRFIDRALHYVKLWEFKEVELAFAFESAETVTLVPLNKWAIASAAA